MMKSASIVFILILLSVCAVILLPGAPSGCSSAAESGLPGSGSCSEEHYGPYIPDLLPHPTASLSLCARPDSTSKYIFIIARPACRTSVYQSTEQVETAQVVEKKRHESYKNIANSRYLDSPEEFRRA